MAEDRAKAFLQLIRRAQRGRLKIYLGYGPGVGKTYQMLQEGQRLLGDSVDVVVGVVETHGREETAAQLQGLELVPRRVTEYRGITLDEMDLDAVLKRHPEVVLVDELAHTNVPGSRNRKRYEDVLEILNAGIHVIATLNVQHLESLYNTVERLIGVKVRERIPDSVLAAADQIVNIDLTPEDLQNRLRAGKIYPKSRIDPSLENFFTQGNLEHLRELTMREIAAQIDLKRREVLDEGDKIAPDQVMVCLASKGPNSARLLRAASRLAGRFNRNWYAVYIQTPKEDPTVIDAMTQRLLADTLTLANQLGATVFTFRGQDVVDAILKFANEYRVGHIVIGRPRPIPKWKRLLGKRSVAEKLVARAEGFSIVVVDAQAQSSQNSVDDSTSEDILRTANCGAAPESPGDRLADVLTEDSILIIREPISKEEVLSRLAARISDSLKGHEIDRATIMAALLKREEQGSTFLNESVAIPHARIEGLRTPKAALAIVLDGISDVVSERPIGAVFMLLVTPTGPLSSLKLLTTALRTFQSLSIQRQLSQAGTERKVIEVLSSQN
jgi:two-component system sensor histidine kinase KdpD